MTDEFLNTLIKTNRSHLFYVDWAKARDYQYKYRDELALLHVLTLENTNPKSELKRLISEHPRINALLPLLVAARIKSKKSERPTLTVLDDDKITNISYNFSDSHLTANDIEMSVEFAEKTGLLNELTKITNHFDYYFGVEVGMDTNARKNRSGSAMEGLVEEFVQDISQKYAGKYLIQTNFSTASKAFNVKVPEHQDNKKGDFMVMLGNKPYNIEVNYFDDGGSKQEIMNSYITRVQDLKNAGWGFILVTDGLGWLQNRRQLEEGYQRIGNILNVRMCTEGYLEKILAG